MAIDLQILVTSLTVLGAFAGMRVLFQLLFPLLYPYLFEYNVDVGITFDGPMDSAAPQEYPWSMLDPRSDGNYPIGVTNHGNYPLSFTVEFEMSEPWPINQQVRIEDVFEDVIPGSNIRLVSHEFELSPGGGRNFTFPCVPDSQRCPMTVTVVPTFDPVHLGIPHFLARYLGEVTLREENRYYVITAEEETVEEYTPFL